MTTNSSKHETIILGVMYAVLIVAALVLAGNVVWWSFANTETILGGAFVSLLLLIPAAALYSLVATPVAGLLGAIGAALVAAIDFIRRPA